MPPLSEFFGSLERFAAELYPYRVPLGALALLVLGGSAYLVHRRGLDAALARWASAHRPAAAGITIAALVVAIPLGYYTLSPLWIRTSLNEPSPLEVAAVPAGPARTPLDLPTPAQSTPAPAASSPAAASPRPPQVDATPAAGTPAPSVATPPVATPAQATSTPPAPSPVAATPQPTPAVATPRVLRRGSLAGADSFHFGRGEVLLIETPDGKRTLRLEGLSVRNGPDLFVYLTPQPESVANAVNLGALKATDGSFNYEVPAGIDNAALANAIIWCRQFGVLFASAPLGPGS